MAAVPLSLSLVIVSLAQRTTTTAQRPQINKHRARSAYCFHRFVYSGSANTQQDSGCQSPPPVSAAGEVA